MLDERTSFARRLSRRAPLPIVRALADGGVLIPYYHVVSDEDVPHVAGLFQYRTSSLFRQDLEFLLRRYRPIPLPDLVRHVRNRTPPPRGSLLLTFDDGFDCMHTTVAPILERLGVPGVFFLSSAHVDNEDMAPSNKAALLARAVPRVSDTCRRAVEACLDQAGLPRLRLERRLLLLDHEHRATVDRIAALLELSFADYLATKRPYLSLENARDLARRGFSIGAHSVDHPRYRALPLEAQIGQTLESVAMIRERIDPGCLSFAFPYSDLGISLEFYRALAEDGRVAVCFGTAGMRADPVPFSLQRFSMEKEGLAAPHVLAQEYTRRLARLALGSNALARA